MLQWLGRCDCMRFPRDFNPVLTSGLDLLFNSTTVCFSTKFFQIIKSGVPVN